MSKIMLCPEKNRDVTNNILVSFKKKKCFRNNIYFEKIFKSSKI